MSPLPAAGGADRAGADLGPGRDVLLRVAHHRGLAGGARRGVDPRHLLARHGEHAERIAAPQIVLARGRKLREVGWRAQVVGMHAGAVERAAVVGDVVIGVAQGPAQPLQLQRCDLVARCDLDRVELVPLGWPHPHRLPAILRLRRQNRALTPPAARSCRGPRRPGPGTAPRARHPPGAPRHHRRPCGRCDSVRGHWRSGRRPCAPARCS